MLLAKAPPSPVTANLSTRPKTRLLDRNWRSSYKQNERGVGLVVRAGYTRTPLETRGAYQLIDDETGEKFIVWGGSEDDHQESPIPSKDVLSWEPPPAHATTTPSNKKEQYNNLDDPRDATTYTNSNYADEGIGTPAALHKGFAGNFGRLKVQKVRARIKNRENSFRNGGRVARGSLSQDISTVKQIRGTADYLDQSDIIPKHDFEPCLENVNTKSKPHQLENETSEISVPRVTTHNLRGSSNGGSSDRFRSELSDLIKQRRKLSNDSNFFSKSSFGDLGCSQFMSESLKELLFLRPSHIQAMAFPVVVKGKSCIIADQSGSGKTLAYLAPVIQRLREEELQELSKATSQSPRVVIMVPTAELASQVLHNCRAISKFGVPFKSMVVTGGFRQKTQLENLQEGVDVLIATPGRFMFLIKEGFLQLTNLRW